MIDTLKVEIDTSDFMAALEALRLEADDVVFVAAVKKRIKALEKRISRLEVQFANAVRDADK